MSEEETKSTGPLKAGLTTGFTTVAQIRREQDVHESVYANKDLLIPTIIIVACCVLGFVFSML